MTSERAWEQLGRLAGTKVWYGITRPGRPERDGVPMLRAGDIVDGQILSDHPVLIGRDVDGSSPQTRLQPGDVAVVLVGRVGEAAMVAAGQEGWNVARSVGVVRCDDQELAQWLRLWLTAPTVRAWCAAKASGSAQATLSLANLRQLPIPLPPDEVRADLLSIMAAIEDKIALNQRIASTSVALADAHFALATADQAAWPSLTFGEVLRAIPGSLAKPTAPDPAGDDGPTWVAPADVLRSPLPFLDLPAGRAPEARPVEGLCPPDTLLLASKPGELRVAISLAPVVAGRGVLAVLPAEPASALWLLHEIRSRSTELSALGQGTAAREISARALLRTRVSWPPLDERERFAQLVGGLHSRAVTAGREDRVLRALLADTLRNGLPALDAHAPAS
ncbi:restriction endonuclease subunit S [Streptacidiphilus melanogenes]|uniref:restriction endonuclease subunit S n=1 Tax=Streptacidiphilus melanogenes TaxID=411235 RepID=UPI0005AB7FAC|nr:restriction endonuclease subunit S [Streptacidiphilus melanogenes]